MTREHLLLVQCGGAAVTAVIYNLIVIRCFPNLPLGWWMIGGGLTGIIGGWVVRGMAR